jgi:hypothetical protein
MESLEGLDFSEPFEIPHQFEIELNSLVIVNHRLIVDAIERDENAELEKLSQENSEPARSVEYQLQGFYEDLRRAANNLATVALVTRIQHWITRFAKKVPGRRKLEGSRLVSELIQLTEYLGDGPIPVAYFAELVNVRDSVIHGDSKAEWEHRSEQRRVAPMYTNAYLETEISNEQLGVAIAKAIEQVTWYDEKLHNAGRTAPPSP